MEPQFSVEEVAWCYRLLLGREPESAEVIRIHQAAPDRFSLIHGFITSREFAEKRGQSSNLKFSPLSHFDGPPILVEADATPEQLKQMLGRIKACWSRLGETKPHWSVLSHPRFLPEQLAGSVEGFWDSGIHDAAHLGNVLARHGFADPGEKVCVEYGCGIGRATADLAAHFAQLHAYDVSPSHLDVARQRMREVSADNVTFHLCADDPLAPLQPCDVYFSRIVLQHNPPPLIKALLRNAFAALKPGGIATFQVPTYILDYRFDPGEYLAGGPGPEDFEIHCLPQAVIFDLALQGGCRVLEVQEDGAAGNPAVCLSNTFVIRKND